MTKTFEHLFDGWHRADARLWINPDGSKGGIVAVSAKVDKGIFLPTSVEVWPNSEIAGGAIIGDGVSIKHGVEVLIETLDKAHSELKAKRFHPLAIPGNGSTANNMSAGDRVKHPLTGQTGVADEFLQDGEALISWEDGAYGRAKSENLIGIKE